MKFGGGRGQYLWKPRYRSNSKIQTRCQFFAKVGHCDPILGGGGGGGGGGAVSVEAKI